VAKTFITRTLADKDAAHPSIFGERGIFSVELRIDSQTCGLADYGLALAE